jgi:type I restriction-modification system DNA methylase subunit
MAKAPDTILKLVENFEQNLDSFKSQGYNEATLRQEFINPFFEALGWDIQNKAGIAQAYKDVIHEDSIKIGTSTKAPDYCFRIGQTKKFFLEAKKPAVDIKTETSPAYQLRRYAWSAKLPLSILTDFEEFAVYDCQIRPNVNDKPSTARIFYCGYKEYGDKWEQIAKIFSKEAVLKGLFDKFASEKTTKRGTTTVDKEFLAEIEEWRNELAKNIAIRNSKLSVYDLNFAVQKTIDRILFLRICEDRGIERNEQLLGLINGSRIYPRLFELFEKADEKYNSGIFHFRMEKDRPESPDELSANLKVDDDVLKKIIKDLYYPCPYEFSIMPAEILGNVYEQFLGKVIRLTASHQAKVEEKPEVKKAGGVYYTPSYIVDYIVKNTVGKLCEGKTPKQIEKLKILDPACGSGSFLIGAYKYLLDYHRDYYEKEASKYKKVIYQGKGGLWFLTIAEKKRILLNNIYGVDIDSQAAEVTKLSLLLKVLENETQESLRLFHERALPDLGNNIKCGNSLIGPDFYHNPQLNFNFGDEQQRKINDFDWQKDFSQILTGKNPGFDCVIGNPPYIFTRNKGIPELQKEYFYKFYKHQSSQLNTFSLFVEKCHNLMRINGMLGFITPNNWLTIDSFAPLRLFIFNRTGDITIANILDKVFATANVDTAITFFCKAKPSKLKICEISNEKEIFCQQVPLSYIKSPAYIIQISLLKNSKYSKVLKKIESLSQPLSKFSTVSTGLKAYQTGKGKPKQTDFQKENRIFHANKKMNITYGHYLEGADVCRYYTSWSGQWLSYGDWLAEPRKSVPFTGERILVRQIPSSPPYLINGVIVDGLYYNDINSMVIFAPNDAISLKYLLGLINSRLLSFWFSRIFDKLQRKIFPQFKVKELAMFPICKINLSDKNEKKQHDKIVSLVDEMLELHKKISKIKNPDEKTRIQRQINSTDEQIDKLVYELYGLTEEEIKIVEVEQKG